MPRSETQKIGRSPKSDSHNSEGGGVCGGTVRVPLRVQKKMPRSEDRGIAGTDYWAKRIRIMAIWARFAVAAGTRVSAVMPLTMPFSTAQVKASTAHSGTSAASV